LERLENNENCHLLSVTSQKQLKKIKAKTRSCFVVLCGNWYLEACLKNLRRRLNTKQQHNQSGIVHLFSFNITLSDYKYILHSFSSHSESFNTSSSILLCSFIFSSQTCRALLVRSSNAKVLVHPSSHFRFILICLQFWCST